jgi:type IV pilus assembly protein PilA
MKISHHPHARIGQGFTLIELMLTIAIFGILAAVAIPAYQNHLKKEKFAEVIAASATAKSAVEACMQHLNAAAGCDGGNRVAAVRTKNGVVTVVPQEKDGILATDTYVLTPVPGNPIQWSSAGSGCRATALCK